MSHAVHPLRPVADNSLVTRGRDVRDSGINRAALAYSLLPVTFADAVNEHLSISERQKLREATARFKDAGDQARVDAVRGVHVLERIARRDALEWS